MRRRWGGVCIVWRGTVHKFLFVPFPHKLAVWYMVLVAGGVAVIHLALVLVVDPIVVYLVACLSSGAMRHFKVYLFQSYILEGGAQDQAAGVAVGFLSPVILLEVGPVA